MKTLFTEGTNLFQHWKHLYSRRIGGAPSSALMVLTKKSELSQFSRFNNAVKVSGRTEKG
jgi:hypothetical protein